MLGPREDRKEHEQMGLLLRFPTPKARQKHQRDTTAPLRPSQQTGRRMPQTWCEHRLLSVEPIVSLRVEGGYAARCLLCTTTGPVMSSEEAARDMLWKQLVGDEE